MDREPPDLARADAADAEAAQGGGDDAQQLLLIAVRWRDLARQAQTLDAHADRPQRSAADLRKR